MRHFYMILILICLFSSASLRAENFNRIGSIRFCGLNDFTEKATKILENIEPKYKVYPIMLSMAVAMNPQFSSFDFSSPCVVYYYQPVDNKSIKPFWCFSVKRAPGRTIEEFDLYQQHLYSKYLEDRVLVSNSRELLLSLTVAPPMPESVHDVDMQFNTASYSENMPDDLNLVLSWLEKNIIRKTAGSNAPDASANTFAAFRELLRQTEHATVSLDIKEKNLDLRLNLTPVKGSEFEQFIALQNINPRLLPGLPSGREIAASFNIAPYPAAHKAFAAMLAGLKPESEQAEQQDYCRLLVAVLTDCNGRGTFYADGGLKAAMPQTCAGFFCNDPAAADKVRQTIDSIKRFKAISRDLYLVYSLVSLDDEKSSDNLFLSVRKNRVFLTAGRFEQAQADSIIAAADVNLPDLSRKGLLYSQLSVDGNPGIVAEIKCGKSAELTVSFLPAALKRMLPPPPKRQGMAIDLNQ